MRHAGRAAVGQPNVLLATAVALSLALGTAGCATATNYLDPNGPVYRDSSHTPAVSSGGALWIVTFNIQFARHVDEAAQVLRAHPALRGADIVLLQEMDAASVERIARALRMNYVYYPICFHPKVQHDFGNAVLSAWPIEATRKLLLPPVSRLRKQAHGAAVARIRIRDRLVQVYSVHLAPPFTTSGRVRRHQAEALVADANSTGDPVIIGGDWNSRGIGTEFERRGYTWTTKDVGPTVHGFSFDHVFARGWQGWAAGAARDVGNSSDHRPVWVVLRPPTTTPPGALSSGPTNGRTK